MKLLYEEGRYHEKKPSTGWRKNRYRPVLGRGVDRTIMAYNGNELVGVIEFVEGDCWRKAHWSVKTAHADNIRCFGYERDDYLGDSTTLFEAKKILEKHLAEKPCDTSSRSTVDVRCLPMYDNGDFYPTPSKLAGMMLRKINWKVVGTVLEPSAGKGDLADAFMAMSRNYRFEHYGIYSSRYREDDTCLDVIESDPNLRAILKAKGYRVVGDDALHYFTGKHYDAIIMNPPFSNGDEHLLKAIEMMSGGGQIVCLLNAETIRNPYSVRRKILQQQISKYNATVEFVEGGFKHAERKSDVEVAIVYFNIPAKRRESTIFTRMKKAEDERYMREHQLDGEPDALVSGNWIEQLVSHYNVEMRCGLELMEEYSALRPYIMEGESEYSHALLGLTIDDKKVDGQIKTSDVNKFMMALRYKYWRLLFAREEITSLMTSQMQEDYRSKLHEMRNYDFTEFNIRELLEELKVQLSQGVHDSILNLFDEFSGKHAWFPECKNTVHYYNGWATNKAHKIGKKAILPINGVYSEKWHSQNGQLDSYHINGVIKDLERAMNYLDRGETAFHCSVSGAVQRAIDKGETTVHFTWFDAKFYKKGTCHITFLPEAERIIERLNIYAGRHKNWLPPCYGKKQYKDMTVEEQRVIDEFQGETEYTDKIMTQPSLYLQESAQMLALPVGM